MLLRVCSSLASPHIEFDGAETSSISISTNVLVVRGDGSAGIVLRRPASGIVEGNKINVNDDGETLLACALAPTIGVSIREANNGLAQISSNFIAETYPSGILSTLSEGLRVIGNRLGVSATGLILGAMMQSGIHLLIFPARTFPKGCKLAIEEGTEPVDSDRPCSKEQERVSPVFSIAPLNDRCGDVSRLPRAVRIRLLGSRPVSFSERFSGWLCTQEGQKAALRTLHYGFRMDKQSEPTHYQQES